MSKEIIKVHWNVERELYEGIWRIVKKRFPVPTRKLHIVVNEALREYIEKHGEDG